MISDTDTCGQAVQWVQAGLPPLLLGLQPSVRHGLLQVRIRGMIIILTVVISGERASPPNDNDGRGELASLNGLPHWPLPLRTT